MRIVPPPSWPFTSRACRPMRFLALAIWAGVSVWTNGSAAAEPPAADERAKQAEPALGPKDTTEQPGGAPYLPDSIYVRLYAGPAYFIGREVYTSDPYFGSQRRTHRTQRGMGVGYGALVGTPIVRDLIVYGELAGSTVSHPTVTNSYDGVLITDAIHQLALGLGAAYLFEPQHYYVSGTLTCTRAWFDYSSQSQLPIGAREKTNLGVGVKLMMGREWWVGNAWAIGMAAQFHLATMGYSTYGDSFDPDMRLYSGTFALLFSVAHD